MVRAVVVVWVVVEDEVEDCVVSPGLVRPMVVVVDVVWVVVVVVVEVEDVV